MGELREFVFEGEAFPLVARLMDGQRSVGDVLGLASERVSWQSAYAAIRHLERKGCLIEGQPLPDESEAAFWDGLGHETERVRGLLGLSVEIVTLGRLPREPILRAISRAGMIEGDGGVRIVVTPDYLLSELRTLNSAHLLAGRPWFLLKPTGTILLIGPLFKPGVSGCWECLRQRLTFNRQFERYVSRHAGREMPVAVARGWLPTTYGFAASMMATELARSLLTEGEEALDGRLQSFDLAKRQLETHFLVRRPQCPACGNPSLGSRPPGPIALVPRSAPISASGPESRQEARDVYERLKHHISPITGIVSALTSREQDQQGVTHSCVAGHYFPVRPGDVTALFVNLVARSGGKGCTEIQAMTGAVCEAIERYSGIAWGDELRREASYSELAPEAVHVSEIVHFSDKQYLKREEFNAKNDSDYHEVPQRLEDNTRISWSPVWSLTEQRIRYLPTAYCYYGFFDPGLFFARGDSNGCAAGSTLEEAILHGFLELVERDAVALWWYNRLRRPRLDAESFGLPRWIEVEKHYREVLGRELHALDLTSDLGIPVVAVVSRCLGRATEDVILGFAAHLDPAIALSKAMEEANQYLPAVQERAEDGSTVYRLVNTETVSWWKTATLESEPYLVPDPAQQPRRSSDLPSLSTGDSASDLEVCLRASRRCGLEVLVLDQTRPDTGLSVVRVVVPGLRHFWRRLAPGRLYDVPVRLGWLREPLAEEELNPISCFV
jgi:ribosomal protein S12 methylthiotransferase accessory factor